MILARSPYYISSPVLSTASIAELDLKINSSTESSLFLNPEYSLSKTKPESNTFKLRFEISGLLRDYIGHSPIYNISTGIINSINSNVLQVNWKFTLKSLSGTITDTESVVKQNVLDGYGYYRENQNPQVPNNGMLLSNDYYIINSAGSFCVPFYNDGTYSEYEINGVAFPLETSTSIITKVQYLWINTSDFAGQSFITVKIGNKQVYLEIQEECRYEPMDVIFKNKFGAWQIITFFKTKKESIKIDREIFKNSNSLLGGYNRRSHVYRNFNTNARESLSLSSGFLPESDNETIRQLLLSEYVFLLNGGDHIPLNVDTSSYRFKTRLQDKLIEHEIDFMYAYDTINNI